MNEYPITTTPNKLERKNPLSCASIDLINYLLFIYNLFSTIIYKIRFLLNSMSNFQSDQSAFNFAVEYLKDISQSFKMCKHARLSSNMHLWLTALRSLYAEVSIKLEDKECVKFEGDLNKKISSEEIIKNCLHKDYANFRNINILLNNPELVITHKRVIMALLDNLEIKLRRIAQQKGMLLPSKSDPRYAVLER